MPDKRMFSAIKLTEDLRSTFDVSECAELISHSAGEHANVLDFLQFRRPSAQDSFNIEVYSSPASKETYRNFLDWLFKTFAVDETDFRNRLIAKLDLVPGSRVLITGCGFGDDVQICLDLVGTKGEVHAQDLSKEMVFSAANAYTSMNSLFTISNALDLPYQDRYFDAVFHFGGINLFGDMSRAIGEMERVCKVGGRVLFGDEGIAPHLKNTEYGKVAISNIKLWESKAPMDQLPPNAINIGLQYELGNCFYIISFTVNSDLPYMNIDIEHKGVRGGTARTRYFGQVEGVTVSAKEKIYRVARERNVSAHRLLSELIENGLDD